MEIEVAPQAANANFQLAIANRKLAIDTGRSICPCCIQSGFQASLFLLQSRMRYIRRVMKLVSVVFLCLLCCVDASAIGRSASYKYKRLGSELDAQTRTDPGIAMMGGGTDLDEAFRWLCGKGNGGDFLILRAHGKDDYNKYVNKLCQMNSVATLIIPESQSGAGAASRADHQQGHGNFHRRRRPGTLRQLLEGNSGAGCAQCPRDCR